MSVIASFNFNGYRTGKKKLENKCKLMIKIIAMQPAIVRVC